VVSILTLTVRFASAHREWKQADMRFDEYATTLTSCQEEFHSLQGFMRNALRIMTERAGVVLPHLEALSAMVFA
jgi:hypothetical protein